MYQPQCPSMDLDSMETKLYTTKRTAAFHHQARPEANEGSFLRPPRLIVDIRNDIIGGCENPA